MGYKGQLDHDLLDKARRAGYVPEVRVWLQEILPNGRGGPMMRRLEHWTQVSVKREIGNTGTATIALLNRDDRFFRKRFARNIALGPRGQDYLQDMLGRTLRYVRPMNPDRDTAPRSAYEGARDEFQGARKFDAKKEIADYAAFLWDFSGVNVRGEQNEPSAQFSNASIGPDMPRGGPAWKDRDLVDLGLFQRVVIDAKGPDGLWYAWFTGLVTGIQDGYQARSMPAIVLQCKDYWRLLQLSEVALRKGVANVEEIYQSEDIRAQFKGEYGPAYTTSNFLAGLSGAQILHMTLDLANRTYCWLPYAMSKLGLTGYRYDEELLKRRARVDAKLKRTDFFFDEGFFYVPFFDKQSEIYSPYLGATSLRSRASMVYQFGPESIEDPVMTPVNVGPPADDDTEFPVAALDSTLLVDVNIGAGPEGAAYKTMIDGILGLLQIDKVTSDQVVKKVADATFYDVFFDPNGNLVYQIPRYNNLPGDYAVNFEKRRVVQGQVPSATNPAYAPLPTSSSSLEVPETTVATYGEKMKAAGPYTHFDFAPDSDQAQNFAQRFHGNGYVITDIGIRSWNLSSSEEAIVTDVEVPAGYILINEKSQTLTPLARTGRVPLDNVRHLQARFGHRYLKTQQIVIPKEFDQAPTLKAVLDAFALALLNQINGKAVGGTLGLHARPDLDIGRTIFLVERQHLFYLLGVEQTVRYGKSAGTTLTLGYGHDIGQQIPNPWVAVRNVIGSDRPNADAATPGATEQAASGTSATSGVAYGGSSSKAVDTVSSLNPFELTAKGKPLRGLKDLQAKISTASNRKLTNSTLTSLGGRSQWVTQGPDTLLVDAQTSVNKLGLQQPITVTTDMYALARAIASEAGGRPLIEQVAVAWTIYLKAGSGSVFSRITKGKNKTAPPNGPYGTYANQQDGRFVSTAQDPTFKHLLVAQAVINTEVASPVPPGGGYFSPRSQRAIRENVSTPAAAARAAKTLTSSEIVRRRYAGGLAWMPIEGMDTGGFFAFAPGPTPKNPDAKNAYGTQPLEKALAEVRKYDSA